MTIEFKQATLPNGLTIIAEADARAHSAAAGFFVRTGARDEAAPIMGVSHFLEHMMFKGTDDLDADAINQGFDNLGARNNAYTSGEVTCFFAQVLPEKLDGAIDLLGRMLRPALRQSDFDGEKSVILEEIAMYRDNPFWVLYEETVDRHYASHGLGHRVLGTDATVTDLTRDQMREYFDDRYSADNTVLCLAGRVDFDRVLDQAAALCGDWQTTAPSRNESRPTTSTERFTLTDDRLSRAYLIMVSDGPAVGDDDRYAAALLAQILGGPDNSRLHWALVETGLADEAQAGWDGHVGAGDCFVYASGDPGRIDNIAQVIEREIAGLADSLIEDDLVRLRARMATSVVIGGERPNDRMQRLGRQWTSLGRYTALEDELERINRVTLDDIIAVLEKYPLVPSTFGVLKP